MAFSFNWRISQVNFDLLYDRDFEVLVRIDNLGGINGTLLANNEMGLTVFDLFGKVLSVTDMQNYLTRNSINATEFDTTAALAIRCFLLLLESKDQNQEPETLAIDLPTDNVVVKTEFMEDEAPEAIENTEQDFFMALPAAGNSAKSPKILSAKVGGNDVKVQIQRSANICRGPGCCCNQIFPSRHEKQQHYIEKGCFRCRTCGEAQVSRAALEAHAGRFLF